ncbi:MAG: putative 4-hydroxybenzoate polyprenyltransferase [Nitrospinota bacterium]|nr:putative 4-hydroxybenzoate polyprenyltransferase [Nitrospinota bacterium]
MNSLAAIFDDIKIQHTLFALPFAVMSAFIAAQGWPGWRLFGLILLAMFFIRSAAMAFNRLVDWRYDAENPRTQGRAIPAGKATRAQYAIFVGACSMGFLATCWFINMLAFYLSFLALAIVFFYSFTKRFTAYSHFFLGLALALAPVGAWVAVREEISLVSLTIGAAVVFWLAGLDTIYSCQDYTYDTQHGLNSIPGKFGVALALRLSAMFHAVMVVLLTLAAWAAPLSWIYMTGVVFTGAMLWYEHSLVRPDDLSRVNVAFFNINGVISVGLMAFTIVDVILLG